MQKFSTWLILSFAVVFWILRVAAAYTFSLGIEFMIKPLELYTEIMLYTISDSSEDHVKLDSLLNYFKDKIEVESVEVLEAIDNAKAVINAESVLDSFEILIKDEIAKY